MLINTHTRYFYVLVTIHLAGLLYLSGCRRGMVDLPDAAEQIFEDASQTQDELPNIDEIESIEEEVLESQK